MTLAPFVLMVLPIATASYIGEKVWQHRRHWYTIPAGLRLPKVEVACIASAVGSLFAGAWVLS